MALEHPALATAMQSVVISVIQRLSAKSERFIDIAGPQRRQIFGRDVEDLDPRQNLPTVTFVVYGSLLMAIFGMVA